jgi:hypothetical protein
MLTDSLVNKYLPDATWKAPKIEYGTAAGALSG